MPSLQQKVRAPRVQLLIVAGPDERGITAETFGAPMAVVLVITSLKVCASLAPVAQRLSRCPSQEAAGEDVHGRQVSRRK